MNETPRISIIIRAYNQARFVADAVTSALAQDYPALQVVVADDHSRDNTAEVLQRFDDPRLHYHRNETNLGRVGNKRRALAEYADGDWALFLDADDCLLQPDFCSRAMDLASQHPELVIVAGGYARQDRDGSRTERLPALSGVLHGDEVFFDWTRSGFIHAAALYRRPLALEIDFYRLTVVGSDTESLLRLCLHGQVALLREPMALWRLHDSNCTQTLDFETHVHDGLTVFESAAAYAKEQGRDPARIQAWLHGYSVKYLDDYLGKLLLRALQEGRITTDVATSLRRLHHYVASRYPAPPEKTRAAMRLQLFRRLGPGLYARLFLAKNRLQRLFRS